ncbi:proton-coupled zinc antiporter SLC30A2 isoform X2 [Drosophila sulfurigaster albostrigata]|uniref:proton-coupled zinc antiporter SLC30A2 isoform X2 n=1 Tax=Drosophila sulfurigaster albostrigata TaxID=89887 RepID=UPI002D21A5F0|nr:proton-coupled zinc antiporter SLC30A2 isoform X2 [Drosophila sulfurigaster albostrigata]
MSRNEDTPIATRCNNYGTTPTPLLQPTDRSCSGDNNNTPLTVPSQIFCLHGRSNNIEVEVRDHCHRARSEGVDLNARRKLIIASILCLVFMIAEIVGGVLSNSLAIATDAAHLLTDFASFMISLFAIWIAGRPSTQRMGVQLQHGHSHSLGGGHGHSHSHNSTKKTSKSIKENKITAHMHATSTPCSASPTKRIEGGVAFDPEDAELPGAGLPSYSYQNAKLVDPSLDLEIAAVLAETAPGAHHHGGNAGHEAVNMNVRAALIHVIGDVIQSVGVFVAAGVIYFYPEYAIVDPICTFVFSIIVLFTTFTIMKDALLVLMEGTPNYMHYAEVLQIFQRINGVERVHNLRIWALSINKVALSVHLAIATNADSKQILDAATSAVHLRYNFFETTIQIEDYTAQMENCNQCTVPEN